MTKRTLGGAMIAMMLSVSAAPAAEPDVRIGMYKTMFRDVPEAVVVALAKPMKSLLEETVGVSGDAVLHADAQEMVKALNEKKINVGVFHGFEYAWIKDANPDLVPLLIAIPHNGGLQATLVINASLTNIEKVADLGTEGIVVARGTKPHCIVYLDELRKGLPKTTAPIINKPNMTSDEVLGEVAAGNFSAAIIDTGSLVGYSKVNKGNFKGLKSIAKSEFFPNGVIVTHKSGISQDIRDKVVTGLTDANRTAKGKPLMMLWGLESFAVPPADYADQCATMLKAYPAPKGKVVEAIPASLKK